MASNGRPWSGDDPIVTVFNHDAWSERIRHLVNEILEVQRRLSSTVIESSPYHFELHNLDYTLKDDVGEFAKKGEYRLLEDGLVILPTQVEAEDVTIDFERAVTGEHAKFKTTIDHKTYTAEEVAEEMFRRLKAIDLESKEDPDPRNRTKYAKKFPMERCKQIVVKSLRQAKIRTGRITEENRQKFLQALGTLRRKKAKRVVYRLEPNALVTINARERQAESCSAAEVRRGDKTIFYGPGCEATLPKEQIEFFQELLDPDGDFRAGREAIENDHDFKTPLNLAIADHVPERKFIRLLCQRENAKILDAWLKNAPQNFYSIEYAWKKREHPKRGEFSPDFFIKIGDRIFVVEVKDDSEIADPSVENQKKFEYATQHFQRMNEWLEREGSLVRYQLNFLAPKDFNKYFIQMRKGELVGFRSGLDIALQAVAENGVK